jgi:hypothetical protein
MWDVQSVPGSPVEPTGTVLLRGTQGCGRHCRIPSIEFQIQRRAQGAGASRSFAMNVLNTSTNASIESATTQSNTAEVASVRSSAVIPPATTAPGRAKVATAFLTRSNDAALIVASGSILVAMTGNGLYPAPVPALAGIVTARNAFVAAANAPKSGTLGVIARRQLRVQLVVQLRSLALYVQQTCNGDPVIGLSSGYPLQKTRQPAGLLPAPVNLRLARGKLSGQLTVRCDVMAQAGSYQWRYATAAAPTVWTLVDPTMGARVLLEGLAPGTQYVVQVRAVGTLGPSDWAGAAALMAV